MHDVLAQLPEPILPAPQPSAPDLDSYDLFLVAWSGGKDSAACLLHLLDVGVPVDQIELWQHDIDGREGSKLMDWPVTRDYCSKVAAAFGLPIYFSWKEGGFEREMLRDGVPTAPTWFETPNGVKSSGGKGPPGRRLKLPQVSADLTVRWCSSYLKIDCGAAALRNQSRFDGKRTLFITGERAEESPARARYKTFEPHRSHSNKRHVDAWRPVHAWSEAEVWEIIKKYRLNPHPAYRLGWGRLSCAACIFGSPSQWASLRAASPAQFARIAAYEQQFGVTIQRRENVTERANRGAPYPMDPDTLAEGLSDVFNSPIFVDDWRLPAGTFGDNAGPC